MPSAIDEVIIEADRGCGRRHAGPRGFGLYLVGQCRWVRCGRMPYPLRECPTCGHAPTHSRGFSWINPKKLFADDVPPFCEDGAIPCVDCKLGGAKPDRAGLMWVGRSFYTPEAFALEAVTQGVSKRISDLPTDFVIGRDIIYLAHLDACEAYDEDEDAVVPWPGIFMTFTPERVELVVDDPDNVPDEAVALRERLRERQANFDADQGCVVIVAVVNEADLADEEAEDADFADFAEERRDLVYEEDEEDEEGE